MSTHDAAMTPRSCSPTEISALDTAMRGHFRSAFLFDDRLARRMVSFQGNKTLPEYRWYKYKEAFSASLVQHLLREYHIMEGRILDPFAGSGTALFAASRWGIDADGIELLPVAQEIVRTRDCIANGLSGDDIASIEQAIERIPWKGNPGKRGFRSVTISEGAYPEETSESIERFLFSIESENDTVRQVLFFALLSVLESISYTHKDGQYLRWDTRSGRHNGRRPFYKGRIYRFDDAIVNKLDEILADVRSKNMHAFWDPGAKRGRVRLFGGSCLDVLPTIPADAYDAIVTSPPYCNRYDYTRTYALELAMMGIDDAGLKALRQTMLSSTVENREKDILRTNGSWKRAIDAADGNALLQAILGYLDDLKRTRALNNTGIPRMVRGYFYEMACVVFECNRVLKPGALLFMVNDNVRYAGADISVDMILSSLAERLGFAVENILVLPGGKGNSSQQMGRHGRSALRKCVYVWRKTS